MEERIGRVLAVAGSDSGGGAGIQADVKTITVLGGYAATAVTALTAQNTLGVSGVVAVSPGFVAEQMLAVLEDIGADVIKTGMLCNREVVRAVADVCARRAQGVPLVVDPVMASATGRALLEPAAVVTLSERLLPMASVVTPNVPEAEALTGVTIESVEDMGRAADKLLTMGVSAALVKGGHLPGSTVVDLLRTADGEEHRYESPRQDSSTTHGTGCTLASALATGLSEGLTLRDAARNAHEFVQAAIRYGFRLGGGSGPLNPFRAVARLAVGPVLETASEA